MIVWNERTNKSESIIKAVIDGLQKSSIDIDGVADVFNNGIEQGCVLQLYSKYNPNIDLCVWVYMPYQRQINNHIEVIIGKIADCNNINMWDENNIEKYSFEDKDAREMHKKTRDFLIDIIFKNIERIYDIPKL